MGCCNSTRNAAGNYDPSPFTLAMATQSKSDYKKHDAGSTYTGDKKILVVCTDDGLLKMANDKVFNTGNHPIEMFVPMLHFRDAGFKFDIATASGKPVVLETWAFPSKDESVKALHEEVKGLMQGPKKLDDIANLDPYAAIFIPGGHGCIVNLPANAALGKLLNIAHERALPTVTLCHGPAVFLSTCLEGSGTECTYKGYKTMCFTDKTDSFTPKLGYIPGNMPWFVQAALAAKGVEVVNRKETGETLVDRELITGTDPSAAQNLGVAATPLILKYASEHA